ncbi:MAG: hypothetical protein IPK74_24950 [Deltaproteobacteria bacterium]|nr:hypothetical protein [Deltaproteobacteria bacterium]
MLLFGAVIVDAACGRRGAHGTAPPAPARPCNEHHGRARIHVLDTDELGPEDPFVLTRGEMLAWVVTLQVVDVVEGQFDAPRLGVIVHSPSEFATQTWGWHASAQTDPALLDLRWSDRACAYEVVGSTPPELPPGRDPLRFTTPVVHSAILVPG